MTIQTPAPASVVIPCYRCAGTVTRALASVFAQTWRPVEVILIDDHSGDDTLAQLFTLKRQYPVNWIHVLSLPENGGPGTARNAGWERASQPYVSFLDADDAWHPKKIEIQLGWMLEHPDAALTGHASQVVKEQARDISGSTIASNAAFSPISRSQQLLSNRFPTRSVILQRDLPHRFITGKRHSEDYLLWCEICLDGHKCYSSPQPLAYLFKAEYGEAGLSDSLWAMGKGEIDTYRRLRESGRLSRLLQYGLFAWSSVRLLRRLILTIPRRALRILGLV